MNEELHRSIQPQESSSSPEGDFMKEAKRKAAEDGGAFVHYVDSLISKALGISGTEGVLDQVLQARTMGRFDQVDDVIKPYVEKYYQDRIRLNPIMVPMGGANVSFRITDLGYVEIDIGQSGSSARIKLSANAEPLGNGDASYSHIDLMFFSSTDTPNKYQGGNYHSRIALDMFAGGWGKDASGRSVPREIPMTMSGQNGAYSYTVEYRFAPGTEGGAFVLDPASLKIEGKKAGLPALLGDNGTGRLLEAGDGQPPQASELAQHVVDVGFDRINVSMTQTDEGIVISSPSRPEIPSFILPDGVDLLSFLRQRFNTLLEDGEQN